ncbi:hypothetical protein E2C01_011528 [Portunus trituberculatus]|uniref:Uncharacterized protein n=1 Tax=Portunus trituberculatus TaxID=210409 RepID=A0A5B7DB97_PORTR|nr:hypothetical protein [Portunus trituberculatus]
MCAGNGGSPWPVVSAARRTVVGPGLPAPGRRHRVCTANTFLTLTTRQDYSLGEEKKNLMTTDLPRVRHQHIISPSRFSKAFIAVLGERSPG